MLAKIVSSYLLYSLIKSMSLSLYIREEHAWYIFGTLAMTVENHHWNWSSVLNVILIKKYGVIVLTFPNLAFPMS